MPDFSNHLIQIYRSLSNFFWFCGLKPHKPQKQSQSVRCVSMCVCWGGMNLWPQGVKLILAAAGLTLISCCRGSGHPHLSVTYVLCERACECLLQTFRCSEKRISCGQQHTLHALVRASWECTQVIALLGSGEVKRFKAGEVCGFKPALVAHLRGLDQEGTGGVAAMQMVGWRKVDALLFRKAGVWEGVKFSGLGASVL